MTMMVVRKRTVHSDQLSFFGAAIRNGRVWEAYLVIKLKNFLWKQFAETVGEIRGTAIVLMGMKFSRIRI